MFWLVPKSQLWAKHDLIWWGHLVLTGFILFILFYPSFDFSFCFSQIICPPPLLQWLSAVDDLIWIQKQSQELTRVNPDRNIFSINGTNIYVFLLYRGLVHHHHQILDLIWVLRFNVEMKLRHNFEVLEMSILYIFL